MGIITAIGDNVEENLQSLQTGRSGIGEIRLLETIHRGVLPAGEIRHSDAELAAMAGVEPVDGLTRTALLGMVAAREAVGDELTPFGSPSLREERGIGGEFIAERLPRRYHPQQGCPRDAFGVADAGHGGQFFVRIAHLACFERAAVDGFQHPYLPYSASAVEQRLQVLRHIIPDGGDDADAGDEDALCQVCADLEGSKDSFLGGLRVKF